MKNQVPKLNKYIQPFAYKAWKIVGTQLQQAEFLSVQKKKNKFIDFAYQFSKDILGLVGVFLLIILIVCSFIIPLISNDPKLTDTANKYKPFFWNDYILGTDQLGRDVWAILWHGLRFSFLLTFAAVGIDLIIGVIVGIMMGYFNKFDQIVQQIIKVMVNIPVILIMILMTLTFNPSFWILVFSMTITGWIGMANQMRAQVKRAKSYEWVIASKLLGTPLRKVIKNFIPILIPMIVTQLVFTIPAVILAETSLAIIGLSIPNEPTLGNLINDGAEVAIVFPRYVIISSFVLIQITISIQFIGNSLQNALRKKR